ncbi:MAG: ribose-5-phosphate isomerase RpiA [Chloroflexi bacterium]|nr:ribose-5-phosphate isomerase RpiA [Chloroflexota bacterium]
MLYSAREGGVLDAKRRAAARALDFVDQGMVVGLGTGSTASLVLHGLAERIAAGLRIVGVPTSRQTEDLARRLGIPLTTLDDAPELDLAIDGADEIDPAGQLIKGLGGALWREKIVARASARFVVVADESKLVPRLGTRAPLPVEIAAFGARATVRQIERLGGEATLRLHDGRSFITDGGNLIADCRGLPLDEPRSIDEALRALPGVVETGLFLDLRPVLVIGTAESARVIAATPRSVG